MIEIELDKLSDFKNTEIIDIREKIEFSEYNIGGRNIPAHEITHFLQELSREEKLLVVCSNGFRSSIVARLLEKKLATIPIFHLTEGILLV